MKRDALLLSEDALVAEARRVLGKFALVKPSISAGGVAAALETQAGHVYTGINLDLACGIGDPVHALVKTVAIDEQPMGG